MSLTIRKLYDEDKGYALSSWRESHKASPGVDKVPWSYYKREWGARFSEIINDPNTVLIGAYNEDDKLAGYLVMSPSKRVHTIHWIQVKWKLDDKMMRRRGIMLALIEAASVGNRFIYTLHARRDRAKLPDGSTSKSLDESLVAALRARGVTASYVALRDWLK